MPLRLTLVLVFIALAGVLIVIAITSSQTSEPKTTFPKIQEVVILGAVVKDVASTFDVCKSWLLNLKQFAPHLRVYIYENNSTDGPVDMLRKFHVEYVNWVHVKSEIIDTSPENFPVREVDGGKVCRISMIAHARNKLVEMIRSNNPVIETHTPIIFIDADFKKAPDMLSLLEVLTDFKTLEVDALFANGKTDKGNYYDIFALRTPQFSILGPELIKEHFWKTYVTNQQFWPEKDLVPVFSAFAGLAIYKSACLPHLKYSELPTDAVREMLRYIIDTYPDHESVQLYNTEKSSSDHPQFRAHSGYYDPVICEHVVAHAELWAHGFRKLFIHPKLDFTW